MGFENKIINAIFFPCLCSVIPNVQFYKVKLVFDIFIHYTQNIFENNNDEIRLFLQAYVMFKLYLYQKA